MAVVPYPKAIKNPKSREAAAKAAMLRAMGKSPGRPAASTSKLDPKFAPFGPLRQRGAPSILPKTKKKSGFDMNKIQRGAFSKLQKGFGTKGR